MTEVHVHVSGLRDDEFVNAAQTIATNSCDLAAAASAAILNLMEQHGIQQLTCSGWFPLS